MSSSHTKKQFERFLLEQFLAAAQIEAEIVDASNEAPDVIIRVGEELVGVEITELFKDQPGTSGSLQGQESLAQRIVANASQLYRESGAQHAHVFVHFAPGRDLRKVNRDETASRLATFVQTQAFVSGQLIKWRPDYATDTLPDVISMVYMLGVPETSMAHWSSPSAGWVAPMTNEILQTRVDEKAALLPKYVLRVKKNWLLLVSDGTKPSQLFELPTKEDALAVVSPFDRTFYLSRFKGVVLELGTPGNAAAPSIKKTSPNKPDAASQTLGNS